MDKNYEITLEQETAKEFGWEVMANFRRLEDNLEENLVLKKIYEKIGEEKIDELVIHMYDDIIPNDDRINILFNDGFEKIKVEQKKFFRLFLGEPGHSVFATPDLRKKHMKLPISIKEAKYWLEDFELALDRLDIDPAIKKFVSQKINSLTMQMINTI